MFNLDAARVWGKSANYLWASTNFWRVWIHVNLFMCLRGSRKKVHAKLPELMYDTRPDKRCRTRLIN